MEEVHPSQGPADVNICQACSEERRSCCHGTEIFLTREDVQRIHRQTGRWRFYTLKYPKGDYVDDGSDGLWNRFVGNPARRRRVLMSGPDGRCLFHTAEGCSLPLKVRPLICRLYPYEYDEGGILGVCRRCPIAFQEDPKGFLEGLGMREGDVHLWHSALYREIRGEQGMSKEKSPDGPALETDATRLDAARRRRVYGVGFTRVRRLQRTSRKAWSAPAVRRPQWWSSASPGRHQAYRETLFLHLPRSFPAHGGWPRGVFQRCSGHPESP